MRYKENFKKGIDHLNRDKLQEAVRTDNDQSANIEKMG